MRRPLRLGLALLAAAGAAAAGPASADPIKWSGNGHAYEPVAVPGGIDWPEAQRRVAERGCGWYLATVTSAKEDAFVFGLVKGKSRYFVGEGHGPWLGAFQTSSRDEPAGGFRWVTPEPFAYAHWRAGEPNNASGADPAFEPGIRENADEGFVTYLADGQWDDAHVTAQARGYIAEYDPAIVAACRSGG